MITEIGEEKLRKLLQERFSPGISLLLMEEFARETGDEIAKRIPRLKERVTKTLDRADEPIRYKLDLIKAETGGSLRELTVKSPSPDFSLLVMTDGVRRIDRTYTELAELSPQSDLIDAFEVAGDGVYALSIKDIMWVQSGLVTLYVDSGSMITFQKIWVVWEELITERQ